MFLAIRNGLVVERSETIESLRPSDRELFEIVEWNKPLPAYDPSRGDQLDPRSEQERAAAVRIQYVMDRQCAYPSIQKQLDMMYWDAVTGTTTWVAEITRIKRKYPKP